MNNCPTSSAGDIWLMTDSTHESAAEGACCGLAEIACGIIPTSKTAASTAHTILPEPDLPTSLFSLHLVYRIRV